MGRETGQHRDKQKFCVINETLIKDCIYVAPAVWAEDDRKPRADKGDKEGRRVQHQLAFHEVACLMFSYKGISRIDNLVGFDQLTKLQLDNNAITRIENLAHLTNLTWLDLSFNKIQVIEGLETLIHLENLSLYSNEIHDVGTLDALTKLNCLSLGKNKLENLDDVAKYLHKFKGLRMLTLTGNRICSHPSYKNRMLGYVSRLKYLDSRLITSDEISRAKEEQREYLIPVDEEDQKEEQRAKEAKLENEENAEYARANVPRMHRFFEDMFFIELEGRNIRQLLEIDVVKERTTEIINQYRDKFQAKAKELIEKMKEIRARKDKEESMYTQTLELAKLRCDEDCKTLIKGYEGQVKQQIPVGLSALPSANGYDDDKIQQLKNDLTRVEGELLERECDQLDAYEHVIQLYDDVLHQFKAEAHEALGSHFEELRSYERSFYSDIKSKFDTWFEERQQNQQQAEYLTTTADSDQKVLLQVLDNKEDYNKMLTEWHEAHIKKLDEKEEQLKKREDEMAKTINKTNQEQEHERNRARIAEIHAYVRLERDRIANWEEIAENM